MGVPRAGRVDELGEISVELPPLSARQLQVRVSASAINPADLKVYRGELGGRFIHARTAPLVSGYDVSGVIEICGTEVTDLSPGDAVFGFLPYSATTRQGAFAERVVVDRDTVGRKPREVSHEIAAAAATPALTALQALRDEGRLAAGGRVLVIGAAGGVGSLAIGVARKLEAHVTAVCSTYAVDFVRGLGADSVVDRRVTDPLRLPDRFDVVLDAAAAHSYRTTRHLLTPQGSYVTTLPSAGYVVDKLLSAASRRRCRLFVVTSRSRDLELLASWLASGLSVPIDARFPVRDLRAGLDRMTRGELRGRIAIDVDGGF